MDSNEQSSEFTTGRTERVNSPEHTQNLNDAETQALRKKLDDEPASHQEGQYDKQGDKDEMEPGYIERGKAG